MEGEDNAHPPSPSIAADLAAPLAGLPPVAAAWAYGSAVFAQPGLYNAAEAGSPPPMVDFLLAVADPAAWHTANLAANRAHYSGWAGRALLGGRGLAWVADALGAGAHFNTALPWPGGDGDVPRGSRSGRRSWKYGVFGLAPLATDLLAWDRLHGAGRLHKPALRLGVGGGAGEGGAAPDDDVVLPPLPPGLSLPGGGTTSLTLNAALQSNHAAAAAAALLTLPPRFSASSFRAALVGLSYGGDIRSAFRVEDTAKVARIAAGSAAGLDALYGPHLAGAVGAAAGALPLPSLGAGAWAQDPRPSARADLARRLPLALARRIAAAAGAPDAAAAVEAAAAAGGPPAAAALVRAALAATVRASSARAAVAGLIASGPVVALRYVAAKAARAGRARAVVTT